MLAGRQRIPSAVFTIPNQRMACVRAMLSYLMFFTGNKLKQYQRRINPSIVAQRITLRDSFTAFVFDGNKLCLQITAYNA